MFRSLSNYQCLRHERSRCMQNLCVVKCSRRWNRKVALGVRCYMPSPFLPSRRFDGTLLIQLLVIQKAMTLHRHTSEHSVSCNPSLSRAPTSCARCGSNATRSSWTSWTSAVIKTFGARSTSGVWSPGSVGEKLQFHRGHDEHVDVDVTLSSLLIYNWCGDVAVENRR